MARRFRQLRALITESLVENDALGLKPMITDRALRPGEFEFVRSGAKVAAFMEWLQSEQSDLITGVRLGTPMASAAEQSWANVYIESAYQKGLRDAGTRLRRSGARVESSWVEGAFSRPIHADRVGLAFTRTFNDLKGITNEMDKQISRQLAIGIASGQNPAVIARSINDRVSKIGITRGKMLARTEVIAAHADATLNSYVEAGIEGVQVEAEWLTAVDACPICVALESDGPYSIDQARQLIPAHPNCRCSWAPIVVNGTGITLQ